MAIEDFQWTLILGTIGLVVGFLLPSGLGLLANLDYSTIAQDPVNFLTGFVITGTYAIVIEMFSAMFGSLFMGFIGLIIDLIKSTSSYGYV